jgi:hypothetical protein
VEGPADKELLRRYPLQSSRRIRVTAIHTLYDGKDSIMNDVPSIAFRFGDYFYWVARINRTTRKLAPSPKATSYVSITPWVCDMCCACHRELPRGVVHSYSSSAVYDPVG